MDRGNQADGDSGTGFAFAPVTIDTHEVRGKGEIKPASAYDVSFPQGIIWGLISVVMAFATSLVNERTLGTLVRLRMAPLGTPTILAGKALACFAATALVMVPLLGVGILVFGISPTSWAMLLIAIVSVSIAMTGLMLLFSTIGSTERTTGNIGWAIMMVLAMTGGGMMPLAFMPEWLQTVSHVSPIKWSILAMEGGLWRGFGIGEMLIPCVTLVAVGCTSFLVGLKTFRV